MPEAVFDPDYWQQRLHSASTHWHERHRAIFMCDPDKWARIERQHQRILAQHIGPTDSVLDAGCGWGRLLDLMPEAWLGDYVGVDLSPDFLRLAHREHPLRCFVHGDLRQLPAEVTRSRFDWAILVSIREMVLRYIGLPVWREVEAQLRQVASQLLYLEYYEDDPGVVECGATA